MGEQARSRCAPLVPYLLLLLLLLLLLQDLVHAGGGGRRAVVRARVCLASRSRPMRCDASSEMPDIKGGRKEGRVRGENRLRSLARSLSRSHAPTETAAAKLPPLCARTAFRNN